MTRVDRFALGAALMAPWLFIWQGLDFTDQGYLVTGYRCFFRHVEATEDSGSEWLTNLFGAAWDALFGRLGLLGLRAMWAACLSLGLWLAFRFVRGLGGARVASLAVLVASVFLSDRRETWFSYNTSSSILFVAAAVCTWRATMERRPAWLFGAGVWIGVVPFARIPNLLAIGLIAAPVLAALFDPPRRARLLRDVGLMLGGVAVGALGVLALIYARGDLPLYVRALRGLFAPTVQAAGYSADSLLDRFIKDQTRALATGLAVCVVGFGLSRALGKLPELARWLLALLVGGLAAWALTLGTEAWSFTVPGVSYWVLGGVSLGMWRRRLEWRVAAFVTVVIVVIAPLGSNNGILNAHMGLWLGVPVLLGLVATLEQEWLRGQGGKLALMAGLALVGEGAHQAASFTYRDAPRPELTSAIGHRQLRGQFTTPARAKVVAEVLSALDERVRPGDYLLAYDGAPLLQYLTKTRPYLNRPWLMSNESPDVIAQLAAEAPARTGCLPVAVTTVKSTRSPDWPARAKRLEEKEPLRSTRRVLKGFLREHGYKRTWKNSFFEIYEPPADQRRSCR